MGAAGPCDYGSAVCGVGIVEVLGLEWAMSAMSMQEAIQLNVQGLFENHYGVPPQDPEAVRAFEELLPRVVSMVVYRLQLGCNCTGQPPF